MEPTDEAILYSAYRIYSDLTDESILSSMVVAPKSAHRDQLMAHELAKHGHTEEPIAEFAKVKELAKEAPPEPLIKVPGRRSEPAPRTGHRLCGAE